MDKLSIIIADKHPVVRIGLERLLRNDLNLNATITHCANLAAANTWIKKASAPVDLLVVGQAFKEVGEIRQTISLFADKFGYEMPVLVFSELDERVYAPQCLAAGVAGFVHKSAWFATLTEAVDTAIKGGYFFNGKPVRREADRQALLAERNNPLAMLSEREREICAYLARQHSCVAIGDALRIHRSTVSTYKNRIFKKLGATNDTQFAQLWDSYRQIGFTAMPAMGSWLGTASHSNAPRRDKKGGQLLSNVLGPNGNKGSLQGTCRGKSG